jgi:hypothetical protein
MPIRRFHSIRPVLAGVAVLTFAGRPAMAQTPAPAPAEIPHRVYETRKTDRPPTLDGRVTEACWDLVPWSTDFTQWEPEAGKTPSQQTAFKILYDADALYIAYRAYDNNPERIANRLARRDWFPGDWVEINIDSRNDRRTGYSFTSSVSGTRGDEFISNDGDNWDGSWDPIWDLKTEIDSLGWTAEVRIPLSQLRFSSSPDQVWGIQVQRRVFREEERSLWQPKRKEDTGWVSRFGELRGLRNLGSPRRLEIFPYVLGRTERFPAVKGNPFADGTDSKAAAGLDGKTGLANLTLDFTINPDFGQVEADPSEVNLSAFETFFTEKRPFFIEGRNIMDFALAPAITGGSFTQDNLFYSRRIGRRPSYSPDLGVDEFAETPENSSIIGAAKLTGKTPGGLSIGILESATARERAEISGPTGSRDETVEPFSNYFVGRLQQDYRQGNTQLGGMLTNVHRRIDDENLEFLHESASAAGLDLFHRWRNRTWYVAVNGFASRVAGKPEAILSTQRSSARYFQRPDNDHAEVDSTRTSLAGHAGSIRFGRSAGEGMRFQTGVAWRSPGFEINDMGFLRRSDEVNQFTWASYSRRRPVSIFRNYGLNANQWLYWDFGGTLLLKQANVNGNAQFKNNYSAGYGMTRILGDYVSNTELRGGPSMKVPATTDMNFWLNTDSRKRVYFETGAYALFGDHESSRVYEGWFGPVFQPSNALRLSANVDFTRNRRHLQYVATTSTEDNDTRYVFADLDQKTLSLVMRIDYTLTPNLTLQYYGAPFVSAGHYGEFKRITNPRADRYDDRFELIDDSNLSLVDGRWQVDEDGDGAGDFSFRNPEFNVREFNSNLVARWEFQPGSVLYAVWSQSRSGFQPRGVFAAGDDLDALFDTQPRNVFLLKVSKWFSL